MKYQSLFIVTLALVFAGTSQAQKLDAQIETLLAKQYPADGPGGAIMVTKAGKILYLGGFGKASIELNVNNTAQNVFEIGSITKQFTAVSILMLEEEGKLSTSDKVTKHLTDYPEKNITIHQLLNHTAGVPNYTSLPDWAKVWRLDYTVDEMLDLFKDLPLDFEPGSQWSYSNSGYIVLGAIIEKVSGISYEEFIEERIFKAIGMNHSIYGTKNEIVKNRAQGYDPNTEDGFNNAEYLSLTQPYAAGSIMSTVEDQNTWIHAIKDNTLINEASKKKAWTNYETTQGVKTNYGYGWMFNEVFGNRSIEHGGGIFGFVSSGIYLPEPDVFVSILTNRSGISPENIAVRIAALAMGKSYDNIEPISMSPEELDEYVAVYAFENGTTRTITREENQLYSIRTGGSKFPIYAYAKDQFYFENSLTRLQFTRNNLNKIGAAITKTRGTVEEAKRTNQEIVEKVAIELSASELAKFAGKYELAPGFVLTIRTEKNKIFAQATGQGEFEIYPKSPMRFFVKVVDAEIEFMGNENEEITKLILYQGGRELQGEKI